MSNLLIPTQRAADRRDVPAWRYASIIVLTAVSIGLATASVPTAGGPSLKYLAGGAASLLAVFGLPSVSLRWAIRGLVLLGALLVASLGELQPDTGRFTSLTLAAWAMASIAAMALASGRGRSAGVLRVAVVAAAVVGAASLTFGPSASRGFGSGSGVGDLLDMNDARRDNAMVASDSIDMTQRPRLTDRTVMTVAADRGTFWRLATYDRWDGRRWTRSTADAQPVAENGRIVSASDDVAAVDGTELVQRVQLDTGFATALPAAATAVTVDSAGPVVQYGDGTLVVATEPLGRGSTYTVTSRQVSFTPDELRSAGSAPVPADIAERYASDPVATDRVRALAASIGDDARSTGGDGTTRSSIDVIRSAEKWMAENTTYSIDAPLAPEDADVVDDFLFTSKQGWCEQVASSLVVLARLNGVPARLVTGYVPGEWDPVTRSFIVRERDAHSWTEVWFAGIGWVSFDPTADVPASAGDSTTEAEADWTGAATAALLALAVVLILARPVGRVVARVGGRMRRRVAARSDRRRRLRGPWDVRAEQELEDRGTAAGRQRGPGETVTDYARAVGELTDDESLVGVGTRIERARYGPDADEPG